MTYRYTPPSEKPELKVNQYDEFGHTSGHTVSLATNVDEQACPAVITEFLNKMNWVVACQHPDTQEPLFTKNDMGRRPIIDLNKDVNLTEGFYFRWYEAVAYEHAKMMSIGLGE